MFLPHLERKAIPGKAVFRMGVMASYICVSSDSGQTLEPIRGLDVLMDGQQGRIRGNEHAVPEMKVQMVEFMEGLQLMSITR